MAGVALGDMDRHFAWQAWRLWNWAGSGGVLGPEWAGWTPRLFAWQAWHLVTCTLRGRRGTYGTGLALVARLCRSERGGCRGIITLRGRCGTYGTGLALVARLCRSERGGCRGIITLRGRCGTYGTGLALVARLGRSRRGGRRGFLRGRRAAGSSLCVAGVALGDMDRHFAWQAWHLWHWAGSGGALGPE